MALPAVGLWGLDAVVVTGDGVFHGGWENFWFRLSFQLRLKPCFSGVRSHFLMVETASSITLSLQRQKCQYGPLIGSDPAVGLVRARNHRILYSSDFSGSQVISP